MLASALSGISGSVTLQARRDIGVQAPVTNTRATASLTLQAGRDILLGADISYAGRLTLQADAAFLIPNPPFGFTSLPANGIGEIKVAGTRTLRGDAALSLTSTQGISGAGMAPTDVLRLRTDGLLPLPKIDLPGGVEAGSGGLLAAFGDFRAGGNASLTSTGGSVLLLGRTQVGGTLSLSAGSASAPGDVLVQTASNLTLGPVSGDDVGVFLTAGTLTQTAPMTVRGAADFGAPSIDLTDPANVFSGPVSLFGGGAVALAAAGNLVFGEVAAGSLSASAGGSIGQAAAPFAVSGALSLETPGGAVTLARAGNLLGGPVSADTDRDGTGARADVALATAGTLTLGELRAAALTLSAGGATGQAGGTALDLGGALSAATAGAEMSLEAAGNLFGGPVGVAAVSGASRGDVALAAAGGNALGDMVAGGLRVSAGGPVTQAAGTALDLAGPAAVATPGGAVTLDAAGNVFGAELAADTDRDGTGASADVTLVAAGDLTLGAVTAARLSAASGGALGQAAGTAVSADAAALEAAGALALTEAGNAFAGTVTLAAASAALTATGPLAVDESGVASRLELRADGALTVTRTEVSAGPLVAAADRKSVG